MAKYSAMDPYRFRFRGTGMRIALCSTYWHQCYASKCRSSLNLDKDPCVFVLLR